LKGFREIVGRGVRKYGEKMSDVDAEGFSRQLVYYEMMKTDYVIRGYDHAHATNPSAKTM
jgi:GH35 family endo-1,4-beta-xylanase